MEDEGLKQSLRRYAIESGAIMERVYRKEMEIPIEDMKQFLDGFYISTMRTHRCKDGRPVRDSDKPKKGLLKKKNSVSSLTSETMIDTHRHK